MITAIRMRQHLQGETEVTLRPLHKNPQINLIHYLVLLLFDKQCSIHANAIPQ